MKVQRSSPVDRASEVKRTERNDKSVPVAPARPPAADRIEWSPRAHELAKVREAALEAPEVRTGLVASLRDRIEGGRYQPDVRLIARGVLEDLRAFRDA